jgi:hypothetical protein
MMTFNGNDAVFARSQLRTVIGLLVRLLAIAAAVGGPFPALNRPVVDLSIL